MNRTFAMNPSYDNQETLNRHAYKWLLRNCGGHIVISGATCSSGRSVVGTFRLSPNQSLLVTDGNGQVITAVHHIKQFFIGFDCREFWVDCHP